MDAIDKRFGFAASFCLADICGDGFVGQEHEFLDELVGVFRLFEVYAGGMTVLVDVEAHFHAVEVDRAVFVALLAQNLSQSVESEYLVGIVAFAGLNHILGFLISEAAVAAYDGACYVRFNDAGLGVHLENHREGEFVLVGTQRADAVGKMFGKHRHHSVDKIYRGGALAGLAVDDGVGLHIVCHISDVHAHLDIAVGKAAQRQGVVEVLGVLWVDGESGYVAHVLAGGHDLGGDSGVDFIGGAGHSLGIFVRQAELGKYGMDFGIVLAGASEYVDHGTAGIFLVVGPVGYAHDCLVAADGAFELAFWYDDVCGEKFRVGFQQRQMAVDLDSTNESLVFLFKNVDDHGFGFDTGAAGGYRH